MAENPNFDFLEGAAQAADPTAGWGDSWWEYNNCSLANYGASAQFPRYEDNLLGFITDIIGKNPQNVGMDIAGGNQATALRNLLDACVLGKALVTNFQDGRTARVLADTRLDHVAGSLAVPETWQEILDWQQANAPSGFDLIMHRPLGGLQNWPIEAYRGAAKLALTMTRPGGLFLTQIPRSIQSNRMALSSIYRTLQAPRRIERMIRAPVLDPSWESQYVPDQLAYVAMIKAS